jgi:hypothetical protein
VENCWCDAWRTLEYAILPTAVVGKCSTGVQLGNPGYDALSVSQIIPITQQTISYIGLDPSTTLAAGTSPLSELVYVG